MLHRTQLSFIQLGGGIAIGVQAEQEKYYSVLDAPDIVLFANISVGVWIIPQVFSQLFNNNTLQIWTVGSALCDVIIAVCMTYYVSFIHFPPSCLTEKSISSPVHDGSCREAIIQLIKLEKLLRKLFAWQ